MSNFEVLGEIVKAEREKRGLSQEALAELAGLSRTHIGDIERGEVGLSFAAFESIAHGLGTGLSGIVKEYEHRASEADRDVSFATKSTS